VLGSTEQLLTYLTQNFARVIAKKSQMIGTKKVFTPAYHRQVNVFVEHYNRTLSTELRRHLFEGEKWELNL
jgi:hypothetical protein